MKIRKITWRSTLIIISFILPAALLALFISCDDDNGPVTPGDGVSKVQGRVTDQGGFQKPSSAANSNGTIEGATVTLLRIQADGSGQLVSNDSVVTDSTGEFVIETGLNGVSNLVVQAEKNSETWKTVVSAAVQHDATVTAQPLNIETTVEANVFSRVVAHGKSDVVLYTDVAMQTDSSIALEIHGNSSATNELAVAIEEMVEARSALLMDTASSATQAQLTASNSLRLQAQQNLEGDLFVGAGNPFGDFFETEVEAYTSNGIDASACALAKETGGMVLIKNSSSLSAVSRFAIAKNHARIRAFALLIAGPDEFAKLGASSTQLTAVRNAAGTLLISINASSNFNDLAVAFDDYHDTIINELTTLMSAQATLINNIDGSINVTAGLKSILKTAVDASASTQGTVNAYMGFYHNVATLVKSTLTTLTSAEIQAVINIMVLANMYLTP